MLNAKKYHPFQPWISWSIAVSFVILVFGFQTGYSLTNIKMAQALSLSHSDIGLIGSTYTLFFAATQMISGSILDRMGIRTILPIACTILTLGIFCFAISTSLISLLMSQIFVAIGASFGFIGAGCTGRLWFKRELYGTMFAWVQFVASISAFLTQQVLISTLEKLPWNWVINGLGTIGLLILSMMILFLKNPPSFQPARSGKQWGIKIFLVLIKDVTHDLGQTIRVPKILVIIFTGAVSFGVMLCFSIVWGSHLLRYYGIQENHAHTAISLSWLGLAIGAPLFAWVGKKLANDIRVFSIGVIFQCIIIIFLLLIPIQSPLLAKSTLLIFGLVTGSSMLPFGIAGNMVKERYIGTSAALVNGSQFLMAGILMALPGYLIDASFVSNIQQSLLILPFLLIIAVFLLPKLNQ